MCLQLCRLIFSTIYINIHICTNMRLLLLLLLLTLAQWKLPLWKVCQWVATWPCATFAHYTCTALPPRHPNAAEGAPIAVPLRCVELASRALHDSTNLQKLKKCTQITYILTYKYILLYVRICTSKHKCMRVGGLVGDRLAVLRVCIGRPLVFNLSCVVAWFVLFTLIYTLNAVSHPNPQKIAFALVFSIFFTCSEPPPLHTAHFLISSTHFCRFVVSFGSAATRHYRQPSMTAANSNGNNKVSNCNRLQCFVDLVFTALLQRFVFCRPAITRPMARPYAAFVCVHVQCLSNNLWPIHYYYIYLKAYESALRFPWAVKTFAILEGTKTKFSANF